MHVAAWSVLHSCLWTNNTALCLPAAFGSLLDGYLGCFSFWLLQVMLLWAFEYRFLCGHIEQRPNYFPRGCVHHFMFPPAVYEGLRFPTPLPILLSVFFGIVILVGTKFYLPLPNDWRCWAPFHILIGYFYIFFGEPSIQILCLFFRLRFFFFIVEWWVLYIFCKLDLYGISKYFLLSYGLSFTSLIVSFEAQNF